MKILSLLIALLISHHWPAAARLRRYDWLLEAARRTHGRGPDWLPATAVGIAAVVVGGLLTWLFAAIAGLPGLLLIGTAAVLFTLGPHHLDRDIALASNPAEAERQQVALERLQLRRDSSGTEAAAASLHAGLARWFGIVFWFALLGPAGCLLYRGIREAHRLDRLEPVEREWVGRVLGWLNWPVVALMTGAIALMTDYDRVKAVFAQREDRWEMPAALLDDIALTLCDPSGDLADGLADGRRLAWRALSIWLAVLSLLLLAGLFS